MKRLSLAVLTSSLLMLSSQSFAGSSSGAVSNVTANVASRIFFEAGTLAANPACATAGSWALDATTPEGKAMYALILTAQATDRTVTVTGNNLCTIQPDRETVQFMVMN